MNTNNRLSWTLRQNFTDSHKKSPLCQYCIIFRIKSKSKKAERAYRGGDNCLLHAQFYSVQMLQFKQNLCKSECPTIPLTAYSRNCPCSTLLIGLMITYQLNKIEVNLKTL